MLLVKRLPWILMGFAVGVSAASSTQLVAHAQITTKDVPPITIKFIGVLEQGTSKKSAVFSSGTDRPLFAGEGQIVLGQYKLLSINAGSVTMSCLGANAALEVP